MLLDDDTDWEELAELLTDSYCVQAPKELAARVPRPVRDRRRTLARTARAAGRLHPGIRDGECPSQHRSTCP